MAGNERIRVLIADDHAVLRSGLRLLLGAQPDMLVVGEAETAEQALALDAGLRPDVLLMDLTLPARPGAFHGSGPVPACGRSDSQIGRGPSGQQSTRII